MKDLKIQKRFAFFILLGLSLLILLFSFFVNQEIDSIYLIAGVNPSLIQKEQAPPEITLCFVGDIMLDRGIEWAVQKYGKGDWKFPFLKIAKELQLADLLFGNLEGPISDKGAEVGSVYSFRNNPKSIDSLVFAGFDILSVANNHIFDYGREAMEDTFLKLKEAEIDYLGGGFNEVEAYSPLIKEINSTKIAFLAYTNLGTEYWSAKGGKSGIAWLEKGRLENGIKKAKEQTDIVIVSMHFGEEYWSSPTPEQKYLAHLAIDSGADLVIGHHSYVIQPIEKYKEGYIAYSLGNFVFDQRFSKETTKGLLLKIIAENGKIKETIPIGIKINKSFQPEIIR